MKFKNWDIFIWERFPPYTHIPFLILFFVAHYVLFLNSKNNEQGWLELPLIKLIILFIGTLIFFLKLRLFDEIKDFENDLKVYPKRPLIRGLIDHKNIYRGIGVSILMELIIFGNFGLSGLVGISIPILYSLLMFKEFFIKNWIRSHLTIYAITHTFVSTLFSLGLLATFYQTFFWNLNTNSYFFALLSWCMFTIFEVNRKTFISKEEREKVESYSKIYGRFGAAFLVVGPAVCSIFILNSMKLYSSLSINNFLIILVLTLGISALIFAFLNKDPFGKIYRATSSVFILMVYLLFIAIYF